MVASMVLLNSCGGAFKPKKVNTREVPTSGAERARKAIEEGQGTSMNDLIRGRRGGTNFEFASSNPMWRASLEVLDFIPMSTIDYSGGMIISEWYSGDNQKIDESIKDKAVLIFDNEPRNKEILKKIDEVIDLGYSVCVWNDRRVDAYKDINEMILNGLTEEEVKSIINECTVTGLSAKLKLQEYKKI